MARQLGCSGTISKVILVLVNSVFLVIGVAFLALGIVLKTTLVDKYLQPFIDDLTRAVPDVADSVNVVGVSVMTGEVRLNIKEILDPVATPLIVVGVFIIILAFLGCCGACCNVRCMLMTFAVIVIIIVVAETTFVIIFCTGKLNTQFQGVIQDLLEDDYGGIDSLNSVSLASNYVMIEFQCCGVLSYEDFNKTKQWRRTRNITVTSDSVSTVLELTLVTPIACCKFDGPFPDGRPENEDCAIHPNDTISNWKTGCWDQVRERVRDELPTFIGVTVAILVFQGVVIICALVLFCKAGE